MRRIAAHAITILAALSMLLCATVCVLWLRADRAPGANLRLASRYVPHLQARYTLRIVGGQFVVFEPPKPPAPAATLARGTARTQAYRGRSVDMRISGKSADWLTPPEALPDQLAAQMSNDDIEWEVWRDDEDFQIRGDPPFKLHFSPRGRAGTPTNQLAPFGPSVTGSVEEFRRPHQAFPRWRLPPYTLAQVARPLLAALEDDRRWIAAHVALDWVGSDPDRAGTAPLQAYTPGRSTLELADGPSTQAAAEPIDALRRGAPASPPDRFVGTSDGLRAEVRAWGVETRFAWMMDQQRLREDGWVRPAEATIDPSQRAALIAQWHGRLDVPMIAVAASQVAGAAALLPGVWTLHRIRLYARRRWRMRRQLCVACGYDLRGSPERCPECGVRTADRKGAA